ncbi:MAG: carotenoid biosynthesis protein [Bacteroidota bacterium]
MQKNEKIAAGIITIVYIVGIVGILLPIHPEFILLTPLNLAFSLYILLSFHRKWDVGFYLFAAVCMLVGFFIEVAGVKTGVIFGEYSYGQTLGPKWLDVPLMMAVNWLTLVYCTGVIGHFLTKANNVIKAAIGATLMVLLDLLIEPVAISYDFWQWAGGNIPLQNYFAWWAISFILLMVYYRFVRKQYNWLAPVIYVNQVTFFAFLNVFG